MSVYDEIKAERDRQTDQWGGDSHDDGHAAYEWEWLIEKFLLLAAQGRGATVIAGDGPINRATFGSPEWRKRMIQVATLAVAGAEWWDRNSLCSAEETSAAGQPAASAGRATATMRDDINNVDDLSGMLPDEIVAVVRTLRADLAAQTARAERAEAALSAERDERAHERQSISVAFGDALRLVHHYGHAGDGGECAENTCRIGRQFQRALAGESGGGDAEA